jgi:hypothetical protein
MAGRRGMGIGAFLIALTFRPVAKVQTAAAA